MFMYLKFDLSVYELSCMKFWLPSNSLNVVQVYMELALCIVLSVIAETLLNRIDKYLSA